MTPSASPVEHGLIDRAQAGDEDAFEQIVALHADRVYGALRRFGLTPADADDVAQEVFLQAWRDLNRREQRTRLSTWLYRIAFSETQCRLAERKPAPITPPPDGTDPTVALIDGPQPGPPARTLKHEFEATLENALMQLPTKWRAAVVLRDLEDLSTKEAAMAMGMREAASKRRLHRGRVRPRSLLEPDLGLEDE